MADKRPSGFRFRLPWLLQPALTSRPAVAPEPPRTTTQTSVSSTPVQRPPFRPPGRAPAPVAPPSTTSLLATPAPAPPASPTRSQPRSASLQVPVASSPPPVPAKSSPPKSTVAKTPDPAANKPTKETQTTSQIAGANNGETQAAKDMETPPAIDKVADTAEDQTTSQTPGPVAADESQPTKETQAAKRMATPPAVDKVAATVKTQTTGQTPGPTVPSAAARTANTGGTQPTTERVSSTTPPAIAKVADPNETQTTRETPSPAAPLMAAITATETASPATPPAIAKAANAIETQPTKETLTTTGTKPTIETTPAPSTVRHSPPFRPPVNIQALQTDTSPSRLASLPTDKPSSSSITTTAILHNTPEIKRSADFALDSKSKGVQTKSSNSHSTDNKITETKSQKPKPTASDQVSLHREIKDDIFKFIRKIATNHTNHEKPESIVTVAGDNTGASMHLASDVIRNSAINGDGSSNGEIEETTAIVNSNIQGINNSMMFDSSVNERNAGVHLGFSGNLGKSNDPKMENRRLMETYRAEASISPQETVVYDPEIGRCVEGVSMEDCELEEDDDYGGKSYEIEVV